MMRNIIYSSEKAEDINKHIISLISPELFMFYHYSTESFSVISTDAKFMMGVNNLYKLLHDSSCIVENMWYILTGNYKTAKGDYSEFLNIKQTINDIRALMNHNNDKTPIGIKTKDTYIKWCGKIIKKDEPETDDDYKKLLKEIEKYGEKIYKICMKFVCDVSKSTNKSDIIERWTSRIYDWYSKKRDIFYNELSLYFMSRCPSNEKNQFSNANKGQMIYRMKRWIRESYYHDMEAEIERLNQMREVYSSKIKNNNKRQAFNDKIDEEIEHQEDEIYRMEEAVREVFHKSNNYELKVDDFTDYFFSRMVDDLKATIEFDETLNLSPESLMQKFIDERFKTVPILAIR